MIGKHVPVEFVVVTFSVGRANGDLDWVVTPVYEVSYLT